MWHCRPLRLAGLNWFAMEAVEEFLVAPSDKILESLMKDQLRKVAEHYEFEQTLPKDLRKRA